MKLLDKFKRKQQDLSWSHFSTFVLLSLTQKRWIYLSVWVLILSLTGWFVYVNVWLPFQLEVTLPVQVLDNNLTVDISAIKSINDARTKRVGHIRANFEAAEKIFVPANQVGP